MTRVGYNLLQDPHFISGAGRTNWQDIWVMTHISELSLGDPEWGVNPLTQSQANNFNNYVAEATGNVPIDCAVVGMGHYHGQGARVTRAMRVTQRPTSTASAFFDSIGYPRLWVDITRDTYIEDEAFYFTTWIRSNNPMWVDVAIAFNPIPGNVGIYWDLGRKFFVPGGNVWTRIGVDEDGGFLPFRSKVLPCGGRGYGRRPTTAGSNSATAATNAREDLGCVIVNPFFRANVGDASSNPPRTPTDAGAWGSLRIYTYCVSKFDANGVGDPTGSHGFVNGNTYHITAANFWAHSSIAPPAPDYAPPVERIEIRRNDQPVSSVIMAAGTYVQLSVAQFPEEADEELLFWSSNNANIAIVDETGRITGLEAGDATIFVSTMGAGSVESTINVTVLGSSSVIIDDQNNNRSNGCRSSSAVVGMLMLAVVAGTVVFARRKL